MKILSDAELREMAAFLGEDFERLRVQYEAFAASRRVLRRPPAARALVKPKFWLTDEEGDAAANAHLQTPCPCGVGIMP